MKAIDKSGREIKIGDYIIYGHALGRCAGLRYGKVLKITQKHEGSDPEAKKVFHLTVIGVDDDWNFRKEKLCERKSTLLFPESRVLVIEEYQMPKEVLNLLKKYEG